LIFRDAAREISDTAKKALTRIRIKIASTLLRKDIAGTSGDESHTQEDRFKTQDTQKVGQF
jgi:hypothetical protein